MVMINAGEFGRDGVTRVKREKFGHGALYNKGKQNIQCPTNGLARLLRNLSFIRPGQTMVLSLE